MKIVNCCKHNVEICNEHGDIVKVYEPSGHWARVNHSIRTVDYVDGIAIRVRRNQEVIGLPEPEEGTLYIVSNIILDACRNRKDLLACGGKYHNEDGSVRGWTAFSSNR